MRYFVIALVTLATLSGIAFGVVDSVQQSRTKTYVTWESLEPDSWASAWLINRHIDPEAHIEIRPSGDALVDGIAFGVPKAQYKRTADQSTFQSLLTLVEDSDPTLHRMGELLATIETTAWYAGSDPLVNSVERHFRSMQDRHGRAYVPVGCYGEFFDTLYTELANDTEPNSLDQSLSQAIQKQGCKTAPALVQRVGARRVAELPIDQVLSEIATEKDVVFVDTREPAEYAKSHIPGAINIPMRDLTPNVYDRLKQADRVISYCVKDFRGYEVARLMLENGVTGAAVMKPHGLSGWKASGLPINEAGMSEQLASQQLSLCAKDRNVCGLN
ncbi:chromate resistance protein ChrB domain-containing protein [Saccharospirillum salsuginis]|uniref:Rhodanese domain-containing protein n=1 Tax=Saccharospirillum salsuginis TaxID=418750 RepID=A0A918NF76_9GAMM|nr:chromate resistance protein ChrB domain-containing protein [Saccharospirillum salsuginis]GGX65965.1 hypothetical protein GCM10007392_36980 [Saccharospirillum salsuginis]